MELKPIYLDLHIHTSENPNNLNNNYDVDRLLSKIGEVSGHSEFLISLTDHNVINKIAYLNLLKETQNVLLGVELHIKNYPSKPPYHCHIFFDVAEIVEKTIDDLNEELLRLYPDKVISATTENVPTIERIIKAFDSYEFILLPHGGQSHSTFDKSVPREVVFDTTLERSIYYNQFDGFTARSNNGLEQTVEYFKKLGINEFVNLITCTDNYNPTKYPEAKAEDASAFVPTWMMAKPNFNGLRLSLSESSRLIYSDTKPDNWAEYIKKVTLDSEFIDIDVNLTPGLNVVIGGSSSGKTLFVDSLYRKIGGNFDETNYGKFQVENIKVDNPSGSKPHYISQNYIIKILDTNNVDNSIEDIEIIKNVFPGDTEVSNLVKEGLANLKKDLDTLIKCVKMIEQEEKSISRIPVFARLILKDGVHENLANLLAPPEDVVSKIEYSSILHDQHIRQLDTIDDYIKKNPFIDSCSVEIAIIKSKLKTAFEISEIEKQIRELITQCKNDIDTYLSSESLEQHTKKTNFENLLQNIKNYIFSRKQFEDTLAIISRYSIKCETQKVDSMGHTLYIENNFTLVKDKLLEVINKYLKTECKIESFELLQPQNLYESKFRRQSPKVYDYDDFVSKVYTEFEKMNKKKYKIITKSGEDFDRLSAGWKTSVLLDIILGYEGDIAPLIIDQPEDNLATNYINSGLITAIKKIKTKKQIILVSHNATIPMLGDAQNVILCRHKDKLYIRSARLEEQIEGKSMVDYIAEITDGGKPSIKKRVKKYNLKNFRE